MPPVSALPNFMMVHKLFSLVYSSTFVLKILASMILVKYKYTNLLFIYENLQ